MSTQMSWMLMTIPQCPQKKGHTVTGESGSLIPRWVVVQKLLLMLRSEFQLCRTPVKYVFSYPAFCLTYFPGCPLSECKHALVNFSLFLSVNSSTLGIQLFHGSCKTLLLWADSYFSIAVLLVCHNPEIILMLYKTTCQLDVSISFVGERTSQVII